MILFDGKMLLTFDSKVGSLFNYFTVLFYMPGKVRFLPSSSINRIISYPLFSIWNLAGKNTKTIKHIITNKPHKKRQSCPCLSSQRKISFPPPPLWGPMSLNTATQSCTRLPVSGNAWPKAPELLKSNRSKLAKSNFHQSHQ